MCCKPQVKICEKCAGSMEELLENHICFVRGKVGVCHVCQAHGLKSISRTACCNKKMCEDDMAKWYKETNIRERCTLCNFETKYTRRMFFKRDFIKETGISDLNRIKALLKEKRYISNQTLTELVSHGLSGLEMIQFFRDVSTGNLMESVPLPVVPAHLLMAQVYTFQNLKKNFSDGYIPRCTNITCAARLIRGWTPHCVSPPILMPVGYTSDDTGHVDSNCLACILQLQEIYVMSMVVEGVCQIDPPVQNFFVMSVGFTPDVALTPVSINSNNSVLEFKGCIGCFKPQEYYRLEELLEKVFYNSDGKLIIDALYVSPKSMSLEKSK